VKPYEGCKSNQEAESWDPIDHFSDLWTSINGPESWQANPWVWAISFRRVES